MNKKLVFILLVMLELFSFAQDEIWMHPNRGQWHEDVAYKINIPGGQMYLQKDGFTYDLNNSGKLYDHGHKTAHHQHNNQTDQLKGHVVKTKFLGANLNPIFEEVEKAPFYENYFLGNDTSKWKSRIYPCHEVDYHELYSGIDLKLYEDNATLKYDISVAAGVNPTTFKVSYSGQDSLSIKESGELVIYTSQGTITEGRPVAYQSINGVKRKVECVYHLEGNKMNFEFPQGYDSNYELIIDPDLVFSTFTGATSDNWGMTACPDKNKNLIAGGVVFGSGYPTTTGAYSSSFSGGDVDVGLTKFTTDGTGVLFSTFFGGSDSEIPASLITDNQNNLYVLGVTASSNFPTTSSAYNSSFSGGLATSVNSINFSMGSDIYISKFNPSGTGILGSTYYGGTSNDGISNSSNNIRFNYGDELRGEVMVDDNSNVYIVSTTRSSNIPIQGGFDNSLNGIQDGVVAKFNSNLSSLLWSSYIGGSAEESGNSIQVASNGDLYVAGGTTSQDFPNTAGQLHSTFRGGTTDGYLIRFNAPSYNSPTATYLGTSDYDQAYFVQLDIDDYVYVFGQTRGNYLISSGVYNVTNSGQFIHKLSSDLKSTEWSTSVGSGSGNEELSPTAFLVSDCYKIYIAGWGGTTNNSGAAVNSTTMNLPVTSDAFQSNTDGDNFYIAEYSEDMGSLEYATFIGNVSSTGSGDHVDGGTSRFDNDGTIYHAVCAACGGGSFPTTPGVYSETNNSNNCNMAAFMFEISSIDATLSAGTPIVCIPNPIDFINNSQNGNTYLWDFGDGNSSTAFQPSHVYQSPGTYTVTLFAMDSTGCLSPDSTEIMVEVQTSDFDAGTMEDTICPGNSVELYATGGDTYTWSPDQYLDNHTVSNPIATIWNETTFEVTIEGQCGSTDTTVTVYTFGANATASADTAICAGDSTQLSVSGGDTYTWTPPESLDDANSSNPWASPLITTDYYVEIITAEGCVIDDTVQVWVDQDIPFPILSNQLTICKGESQQVIAGGATSYQWSPDYNISATNVYNPYVYPASDTTYYITFTNACGDSYDSLDVTVIDLNGSINPDTIICPEGEAVLSASGGADYRWSPVYHLSNPNDSITTASPHQFTTYTVYITDEYGCTDTLSTNIDVFDSPEIEVSAAAYAIVGDTVEISANGDGIIVWSPDYNISCTQCTDPFVWPEQETIYTATVTDSNSCKNSADVPIYFEPLIYVPNAFTPNGDHYNNTFKAVAHNIIEFEMLIFNRWGELIATLNSPDQSWDGSYKNQLVKDDVYVWVIKYTDINENPHELRGHVTVLK